MHLKKNLTQIGALLRILDTFYPKSLTASVSLYVAQILANIERVST